MEHVLWPRLSSPWNHIIPAAIQLDGGSWKPGVEVCMCLPSSRLCSAWLGSTCIDVPKALFPFLSGANSFHDPVRVLKPLIRFDTTSANREKNDSWWKLFGIILNIHIYAHMCSQTYIYCTLSFGIEAFLLIRQFVGENERTSMLCYRICLTVWAKRNFCVIIYFWKKLI